MATDQELVTIVSSQPPLFSLEAGFDKELVEQAKSYAHTGKTVAKDHERVAGIVEALLSGVSQRKVARSFHVSPNNLRKIVHELEASGKMDALKQRLSSKMGALVESSVDLTQEMVDDGAIPANVLPILIGVISDKKALLDGEATVIVGRKEDQLSVEKVNAWWDGMKRAVDVQSDGEVSNV